MRTFVFRAVLVSAALVALPATPTPAIVGGSPADAGEYPWMAAIYSGASPSSGQYCGGSLVAPRTVVTAKHCIFPLLDATLASLPIDLLNLKVKVMLGENRLSQHRSAEKIVARTLVAHPNPDLDLAVITLTSASTKTPIAWAGPGDESFYAPGTAASITGWGYTAENGSGSDTLLEAEVPIVSDDTCAENYDDATVANTEVCAGYAEGGVDTCQGDSGGPLMVPGPGGRQLLVGVTSWGDGCGRPNKPGVYAEVVAGNTFIQQHAA